MILTRTTQKGVKRYQVRVGNRGLGTYDTLKEARQAERDHFHAITPTDSLTVEQLITRYLDLWAAGKLGKKPKPNTYAQRKSAARLLTTFFQGRQIDSIKPTEAEDFCIAHVGAAATANALFNYAVKRGLLTRNEFTQFVPKPGPGRSDLDPLSDQQVHDLQQIVEGKWGVRMGAMVPFWAYSGLRSTELYNLDWPDIDWDAGEIIVRDGKTGPRRALLLEPAREAIEAFRGIAGPVFTLPMSGKRFSNQNMCETYTRELRKHFDPHPPRSFDWYELRHFNAHLLYVRMDVPSPIVAAHLGNSPEMVERTYGHYKVGALDRLREAVKAGIPRDVDDQARTSLAHSG